MATLRDCPATGINIDIWDANMFLGLSIFFTSDLCLACVAHPHPHWGHAAWTCRHLIQIQFHMNQLRFWIILPSNSWHWEIKTELKLSLIWSYECTCTVVIPNSSPSFVAKVLKCFWASEFKDACRLTSSSTMLMVIAKLKSEVKWWFESFWMVSLWGNFSSLISHLEHTNAILTASELQITFHAFMNKKILSLCYSRAFSRKMSFEWPFLKPRCVKLYTLSRLL